jgi:tRNA nucleotidyltransferase (CCA-adding enzyme)
MKHLAVNGKDMMELGVPQGQEIGRILNALLDQVVDGKLANEKALLLNAASNLIQN